MKKFFISAAVLALFLCGFSANATVKTVAPVSSETVLTADDWDKVLDEYEKYVNQYIKTYKKAMNGDMSAMADYAKLLEKAQKLSAKLEKAKGQMTDAQLKRYMKITQKMTEGLM